MVYKAAIIGSGNWGSAIAGIVGETTRKHYDLFDRNVKMWVFEEMVNGKKLSEIINEKHENVKYLPGKRIPDNIFAEPDLVKAACDADILIFIVPHQFVFNLCKQLKGKTKLNAIAISLIKGITVSEDNTIKLISKVIKDNLNIDTACLMGANLAHEVASENFCEATIGCENQEYRKVLKLLFHTDNFRISVVTDASTVELCGALKNIVACAAGFIDGLGMGDNTKAAVIRNGMIEITRFVSHFYPGSHLETFFESCGFADLITTCYGGRNRRVAEAFVKTGRSMKELEVELLGGQRLQGPHTAELVYRMIQANNLDYKFPLFTAVHLICTEKREPSDMISFLRNQADHSLEDDDEVARPLKDSVNRKITADNIHLVSPTKI